MDTHTHTQDNYSNPRCGCTLRVNETILHINNILELSYICTINITNILLMIYVLHGPKEVVLYIYIYKQCLPSLNLCTC